VEGLKEKEKNKFVGGGGGSISETWENQENNVKVDFKELDSKSADWIEVHQDKF